MKQKRKPLSSKAYTFAEIFLYINNNLKNKQFMRKFTKLMLALAMFVGGVIDVAAKTLEVDLSQMPATSENTTWTWNADEGYGLFEWSQNSYNSTQLFAGGDYSAYTALKYEVEEGTCDHFRFIIKYKRDSDESEQQITISVKTATNGEIVFEKFNDGIQNWQPISTMTPEMLAKITTIRISGASETEYANTNVKVKKIWLEGPDVNYIEATPIYQKPDGVVDLKDLTGTNLQWSNFTYPKTIKMESAPELFCGDGDGSYEKTHVTITDYDYLVFGVSEASPNAKISLRIWIWDAEIGQYEETEDNKDKYVTTLYPHPIAECNSVTDWKTPYQITASGIYAVKVSDYKYLKGIKNNWGDSGAITISTAYAVKGNDIPLPKSKYTLIGDDPNSVTLNAALADETATYYDATLVGGKDLTLTPANPNALFVAKEGALANEKNVIVSGTCANLVLTDSHPFATLDDFTATKATYSTTINASAKAGTLCLPFAATIPEGTTAYTLTYTDGETATATPVETTIPANTPVLLNGSGAAAFTGSAVEVKANADNTASALTGVFAETTVPVGSYVLQSQNEGVGFYKVTEGSTITAKPFRAYLTAEAAAARLNIVYGETTGISTIDTQSADAEAIYTLNGVRVSQPTKGIYVKNGKKFIVK